MSSSKSNRRREPSKRSGSWIYALIALQATSLLSGVSAAGKCLRFADERKINKLFSDGGPGTKISLCQGQTYRIDDPIVFTSKDQELATEGYPEDDALKATIVVTGGKRGVAVQGDCRRCARVSISHLIIDGNRSNLGRIPNPDFMTSEEIQGLDLKPRSVLTHADLGAGTALVLLGNNEGQKIRSCTLKDPRGWTAIQIREGDSLSCTGAIIEDNVIGPAGEEWKEEIDGESPELSPLGRPLADGLSLACRDSYVVRNTFIDATEASINIFCSPGSLISSNHIIARSRTQMGGILMIDSSPFNGDYSNTRVENNTIEADEGVLMRVAIGLGSAIWSDDTETVLSGGSVTNNRIRGLGMGYGIAAAGLKDFTVVDNESLARHGGRRGERCLVPVEEDDPIFNQLSEKEMQDGIVVNPIPQAFLKNSATIEGGDFQEDFVEGDYSYLVCLDVDPDDKVNLSSKEGADEVEKQQDVVKEEVRQAPPPPRPVAVEKEVVAVNTVMDNIFSHSQARMLEVIEELGAQVEALKLKQIIERQFDGSSGALLNMERDGAEMLSSVSKLSKRILLLESDRQIMQKAMDDIRRDLRELAKGLDDFENHETATLSEVLTLISAHPSDEVGDDASQGWADEQEVTSQVSWWTPFVYIIGFQLVVVLGGLAWRGWNRRQDKGMKRI